MKQKRILTAVLLFCLTAVLSISLSVAVNQSMVQAAQVQTEKPAAPGSISLNVTATGVKISWEASPAADSYWILRSDSNTCSYNKTFRVGNVLQYTDTTIRPGQTCRYTVRAVNSAGSSANAPGKSITFQTDRPAAPASVTVSNTSNGIRIVWTASAGATSYRVLRSNTNSTVYQTAFEVREGTSYIDATVENGKTYRYTVRAVNAAGSSANAPGKSVTFRTDRPAAPASVTVSNTSNGIRIVWTASAGATSYRVLRSNTNSTVYQTTFDVQGDTTFTDTTAENGKIYRYTVKARNAVGFSANAPGKSIICQNQKPQVPSGLTVRQVGTSAMINWNASVGADSYLVLRSDTNSTIYNRRFSVRGAAQYIDREVTAGRTYRYTVRACNAAGSSANAQGQSITIQRGGWVQDEIGYRYVHADGSYTVDDWEVIDGNTYHFDSNGYRQTGWIVVLTQTGQGTWENFHFYMDENGIMQTCLEVEEYE